MPIITNIVPLKDNSLCLQKSPELHLHSAKSPGSTRQPVTHWTMDSPLSASLSAFSLASYCTDAFLRFCVVIV